MGKYADIKGTTSQSFRVGGTVSEGNVLTADEAGVGTWQAPTGGSATLSKSFMITNPTAGADGPIWRAPANITITAVHALCVGGTNLIGSLWEYDANGGAGAIVQSSYMTATAGINANATDFANAGIALGNYVGWVTDSISGTPTRLIVTFEYTEP